MNVNSLKRAGNKALHRVFIATLIAMFASPQPVAGATVTIVDTLGAATPATQFDLFESTGLVILESQFVGPQFTLTQPTTLTEIGGFVNSRCVIPDSGEAQCSSPSPLIVQIRPSINGVPDPSTVLASFFLSHDNDPLVVSYESVAVNLPLQPGSYFALFGAQTDNAGLFLSSATSPFNYQAGLLSIGVLNPISQDSIVLQQFGAARILGETDVFIGGCDSGVTDIVLPSGSTLSELIAECANDSINHGQFVSCISGLTGNLKKAGIITGQQKGAIQSCAARGLAHPKPRKSGSP